MAGRADEDDAVAGERMGTAEVEDRSDMCSCATTADTEEEAEVGRVRCSATVTTDFPSSAIPVQIGRAHV